MGEDRIVNDDHPLGAIGEGLLGQPRDLVAGNDALDPPAGQVGGQPARRAEQFPGHRVDLAVLLFDKDPDGFDGVSHMDSCRLPTR